MTDLRDLVGTDGLDPREEARLHRVHELLLQAGPPPELPATLARWHGGAREAEVVPFPLPPRRRWTAALAVAAVAAVAFGGGYVLGHSKARPATFAAARVVPLHGANGALAVLRVANADSAGNWTMAMTVSGLRPQPGQSAGYELWLTKGGQPLARCGSFRVHGGATTVLFTVSYPLTGYDGWVVTARSAGEPEPGRVVLTT